MKPCGLTTIALDNVYPTANGFIFAIGPYNRHLSESKQIQALGPFELATGFELRKSLWSDEL